MMRHATTRRRRPMGTSALRTSAMGLLATGLLLVPSPPATAAGNSTPGNQGQAYGRTIHAASRAVPNPAHPVAVDSTSVWAELRPAAAPATASATVETDCAGCSGRATTLQVLTSAGDPAIRAGNSATAYTTGDWASSSAVSVQVIAAADARSITANNQAISVNQGCTGCTASTVAIQFILVGVPPTALSATAQYVVAQIEQALALDLLAGPTEPRDVRAAHAHAAAHDAAARASAVIGTDTGAGVETRLAVDPGN